MELLGGLADIPIRGDEHRNQRRAFVQKRGRGIAKTPAKLLGHLIHLVQDAAVPKAPANSRSPSPIKKGPPVYRSFAK